MDSQASMRRRVSWIAVLAAVVSSSFGAAQKSSDVWWPQFRGPNSTGVGAGRPPVHFGPNENVLWKTAVGSGLSSPIVWDDRIFLTDFDRANKQLSTLCIDRHTGKILWQRTVSPDQIERVHEISSPAGATPATDGERVYVYFGSYGLVSYDLNGNLKWERRLPLPENPYGAVASPIVAGELLLLNHQGKDAYLLAVNRRDGRTVWKTDRSMFQYGWSTPLHWRHDGIDEIIVLGGDFKPNQRLMAYALADGAERWWVGGLPPSGKSTPVVGDGLLFFAAPDIILETAAERRDPERAAQFYANNSARVMAVRPGTTGELSQANIAWSERRGVPGVPSPLYYNGRLYTFQNGGIVFCRVARTGDLLYTARLGAPGYYYSSPVAADQKIYIASEEGVVVVLDGGAKFNVLATNKLDGAILATPALAGTNIYVRTDSYLYAFGAQEKPASKQSQRPVIVPVRAVAEFFGWARGRMRHEIAKVWKKAVEVFPRASVIEGYPNSVGDPASKLSLSARFMVSYQLEREGVKVEDVEAVTLFFGDDGSTQRDVVLVVSKVDRRIVGVYQTRYGR